MSGQWSLRRSLKTALAAALICFSAKAGQAAVRTSSLGGSSGNWSNPSTWLEGAVPTAADTVTITWPDIVSVDIPTATASTTTVYGTLRFSTTTSSSLTLVGGNIRVEDNGALDMGTAGTPIPSNVKASLILSRGAVPGQFSLNIANNGIFHAYGGAKAPMTLATVVAPIGATSIQIADDPAAMNWQIGDQVVVDTEPVTITGLGAGSISFTPPLTLRHLVPTPTRVLNLTRNVVIRSSGTDVNQNTSYIFNTSNVPGNFLAANTEFAYLGANGVVAGITFNQVAPVINVRGSISSSTIHDSGSLPLYSVQSSSNTFSYNVFARNAAQLLLDLGSNGNTVSYNQFVGSGGGGIGVFSANNNQIIANNSFGNRGDGIVINGVGQRNFVAFNNAYGNDSGITVLNSSSNTVYSNNVYNNNVFGISVRNSNSNAIASNSVYRNTSSGVWFEKTRGSMATNNTVYGNVGAGFYFTNDLIGETYAGNAIGYTPAGASAPNGTGVFFQPSAPAGPSYPVFKDARINIDGVVLSFTDFFNAALLSYNQDYATGTLRLYGNYTLAGSTLALSYPAQQYGSIASPPKLLRGLGHTAAVTATFDANAVTQIIFVTYRASDGLWHVAGSASAGDLCTLPGAGSAGANCPSASPQFTLALSPAGAPADNDMLDFSLVAASRDANTQKSLLFGDGDSNVGFNSGRSKLAIAPSAGLSLTGTPAFPTLVDMTPGGTYYTLVDSGALTMANASVANTDFSGLQLSGSAGVSISSSVFDFLGIGAATNTYITAAGLTSNTTFFNVAFNASRSLAAPFVYNVIVGGPDAGLNWTLRGKSGALWGPAFAFDPNARLRWADAPPNGPIAITQAGPSSITASWGPVASDGYVVDASTAANFTGLLFSSTTRNAAATSLSPQGLDPNTTYYLRVGALWVNAATYSGTVVSTASQAGPVSGLQLAGVFQTSATLNWAGLPLSPPAASSQTAEGYVLQASTTPGFSSLWASSSTANAACSTLTVSGLDIDATYYFRVGALNWTGSVNYAAFISTFLVVPPSPVTSLSTAPIAADNTAVLNWTAPGNHLTVGTASKYDIRFAPTPITEATFGAAAVWSSSRPVSGPLGTPETEVLNGLTSGVTYYFALRTQDTQGYFSAISNVPSYLIGKDLLPGLVSFSPPNDAAGVSVSTTITAQFAKTMSTVTFSVTAIADSGGNPINQPVAGTNSFSAVTKTWTFVPASLSRNFRYQVVITTGSKDSIGNPLSSTAAWTFTTLLDHTAGNTIIGPQGIRLVVPPNAFAADGVVFISTGARAAAIQSANQRLLSQDSYSSPISLLDIKALDTLGSPMQPTRPLTLATPYSDVIRPGIVDGTSPPVRAPTLALWWLDPATQSWMRIPGAVLDPVGKTVNSPLPHFSIFALIGGQDTSLAGAHAFPVPYIPSKQAARAIRFTGLSSVANIKIYTVDGQLVRTLDSTDGSGTASWDVRDSSGNDVASGVYLYVVANASEKSSGKLVIIK